MGTCIALFRGINVGGKNVLPMWELVAVLEGLGCSNVRTYIQSGNAVFEHPEKAAARLAAAIAEAIEQRFGFEPHVQVLAREDLDQAIAANPFPEAAADPGRLHLGFLAAVPTHPDLDALGALAAADERYRLIGRVFYLHAPHGVGNSRLASRAEKLLGVPMTDRNWNTVSKLRQMAGTPTEPGFPR